MHLSNVSKELLAFKRQAPRSTTGGAFLYVIPEFLEVMLKIKI